MALGAGAGGGGADMVLATMSSQSCSMTMPRPRCLGWAGLVQVFGQAVDLSALAIKEDGEVDGGGRIPGGRRSAGPEGCDET